MALSHKELCKIAVAWLKRPASRCGHGCKVAIDECRTGWDGEIPDALGYRFGGAQDDPADGTVMVECKASRADFLADKNKPHRKTVGVGNWRYFLAPEGIIAIDELPPKWGLIEVNSRGHIKVRAGAFIDTNYRLQRERLLAMRHESQTDREMFLLVRLFDRTSDHDKLVDIGKERNRLITKNNAMQEELRALKAKHYALSREASALKAQLEQG